LRKALLTLFIKQYFLAFASVFVLLLQVHVLLRQFESRGIVHCFYQLLYYYFQHGFQGGVEVAKAVRGAVGDVVCQAVGGLEGAVDELAG
jgi:hypothetical protein